MITPELQRRAEDIFFELVERGASAAEVAAECGDDPALIAEVESLLAHHRGEGVFLNTGRLRAIAAPAGVSPLAVQSRVGGYTILGVLGTGGMGVVYVAQQERPCRTVALKVIRRELASPGMLRRFEHEAEMLGRLQHPGIAQIFEAGSADSGDGPGQPFISMELVNGPPLTQHADQRRLGTRDRLELFLGVCEAVQHAHQRGVIHRDLKPANILVDEHVAPPRPKILDFGVSRLADPDVQGLTQHTSQGQLIGTLPYMSPEQVVGDPAEVDTRADVYALGVILYQLLAGRLPLDVGSRSIPEAARVIRDDAPPRLGTVDRSLRGDLETIVATALEKDKARRYQSAADLADDIRRFLSGRPIAAKDSSALDVLRRQIRRYRGTVAVGAVSMIALVALAALALRQSWQNERLAVGEAAAKTEALIALDAARTLRARADEAAGRLEVELAASRVERGRLLGRAGNLAAAEALIWPEHLKDPGSKQTYWALWELYSLQPCIGAVRAHGASARGVAMTPDGSVLVSGGEDGVVRFWESRGMRMVREVESGVGRVADVALSPDGERAAWCGTDGGIALWDMRSGTRVWVAAGHAGGAYCVAFSADGRRVASGGEDRSVRLWDSETGAPVAALVGLDATVLRVAFRPGGQSLLAMGCNDATVRLWDGSEGSPPRILRGHTMMVSSLSFSPDGGTLASGSGDRRIYLWDPMTGERTGELFASNGFVRPVVFGPDGRTLFSAGWWTLDQWDVRSRQRVRSSSLPDSAVAGATSADGRLVALSFATGDIRVWEVADTVDGVEGAIGAASALPGHVARTNVALSPDARVVATGDGSGLVRLWETPRAGSPPRLLAQWKGHSAGVRTLEFSRDGTLLATGGEDAVARVWDVRTGRETARVARCDFVSTRAASFSPDGTLLALARQDTTVTIHRLPDLGVVRTMPAVNSQVASVCFSHDGRSVAATSRDRGLRLWPVDGPETSAPPTVWGVAMPWTVAFTPGGARMASGDWGKGIDIWDLKSLEPVARLDGHSGLVTAVDYLPAGPGSEPGVLASAAADGTIRLWDARTGRGLLTLDAFHGWDAVSMAIGGGGRTLVAGSLNGDAAVWDLEYYNRHIAGNVELQLTKHASDAESAAAAERLRAWARGALESGGTAFLGRAGVDPETIAAWGRGLK